MLKGPTATEAALMHLDRALVFSVLPEKSADAWCRKNEIAEPTQKYLVIPCALHCRGEGVKIMHSWLCCFHVAGGASGGSVMMKQCKVALKKSGSRVPTVELIDIGPSLTMLLGRYRAPSSELYEQAVPKVIAERYTDVERAREVVLVGNGIARNWSTMVCFFFPSPEAVLLRCRCCCCCCCCCCF